MAQTVTPRQAVYAHLQADPNVSGLVGGRIYHVVPPMEPVFPLIVLNTISNTDRRDLGAVAYTETRIQVTVMATDPPNQPGGSLKQAETIAMAVRRSLEGYQGMMAGALPVLGCRTVGYMPAYEDALGQTHYHVDVIVVHEGGI